MKKWKKVAFALTAVMMFTTVAGVTACKKKPAPGPSGPGGDDVAVTLRDDPRVDAYAAYAPDGTEIGKYKTIAAAINAAVDRDAAEEDIGSYVRKIGGRHDLFKNRRGYEDREGGNDDMFWFYEEGTKLDMLDCWQNGQALWLQNTDYVVTKVSHYGTDSVQNWNGFRILDEAGEPIGSEVITPPEWELSSTMDASMMSFPTRLNGNTKQTYQIDLSSTQITPPYKGADKTYAFMGFYNWQGYYVVDIGIACDTATGVWYPFMATSRNDSFSDADYKFEDKVIMKSTWNEAGGYFKPDIANITMSIETQTLEDGGEEYQSNLLVITNTATNEKLYEYRLENEVVADLFTNPIKYENTYIFNAGLDIKSELAYDSIHVKAVDYFNGAKFENLKITSAQWEFPTVEEMSNTKYGNEIADDLRGKEYNVVLADANKTLDEGVFDYVLLNNSYFVDYSQINGADVYSFSFDKPASAEEDLGTTLGGYQYAIDELIGVTEETVVDFAEKIETMNAWDKNNIPQQYYQLLDFEPLKAASALLTKVMALTEPAQKVRDDFNALEDIDKYAIKGWEASDGTPIKGYLWSEIQKFNQIYTAYGQLGEEDQNNLKYHINKTKFEKWVKLADEMTEAVTALQADATTVKFGIGAKQPTEYTDSSLMTVFEEFIYLANGVKAFDTWPAGKTLDAAAKEYENAKIYTMHRDANWYASTKIIYAWEIISAKLKEADVDVPEWIEDLLEDIEYDEFYEQIYYPLYGTALAALKIKNNVWQNDKDLEDFLNEVWGAAYSIPSLLQWNWTDNTLDNWAFSPRCQYLYKHVFLDYPDLSTAAILTDGLPKTPKIFEVVGEWITDRFGYEIKDSGWGVKQGMIDLTVNVSEEAQAVIDQINALSALGTTYRVIEWTAPEGATSIKGYYYSEILAVRAAKTDYDALSAADKLSVTASIDEANWNAWLAESTAFAAIEAKGDALTALNFKIDNKRALTIAGTATGEDPVKYDAIEIFTGEELVAAGSTAPQAVAHPTDTFYETVYVKSFPAQTSMENGVYAMRQMLMHASFISTTVTGMKDTSAGLVASMTANNGNQNRNIRISLCYDYLVKELEVELTPYMQSVLDAVDFDDWYVFYEPVAALIPVAARINALGASATVADLDEADLALLNKYYTNRFTPNAFMTEVITTLGSGYRWRAPVFVKALETVLLGMESPDANPAGEFSTYFANGINTFLVNNGYTIAQNGWGVTVGSISAAEVDRDVMAAAALIAGISTIDDNYTMIGWEAPTGTPIAGYTYSEYLAYKEYVTAYAALSDAQKAEVDELANAAEKLASWEAFAPEIEKLITNPAWDTFTFSNALLANMGVTGRNWGDDGPGTFTENQQNGLALVYILKWTKSISTSTNAWGDWNHANVIDNPTDSVYAPFADMYWIYRQLDKAGLADDLPTMVKSAYNAVLTHYTNGVNYTKELEFLFGASEIILKKEAGTATKAEVVKFVNTYMVNKKKWSEGGMQWNYVATGSYSWGSAASDCMGRVDAVLQRYYSLPATATIGVQVKAILDMIPDVPRVAFDKAPSNGNTYSPIGVTRQITVDDVTGLTQAPGYVTTQSGTLLPYFNTGWGINAGIDVNEAADMTFTSDNEGYKFTGAKENDYASLSAYVNKTFAVKGKALYYNIKVTGEANSEGKTADLVIYVKNGASNVYCYLGEQFATPSKNKITGEVEGYISLAQIQQWLVDNKSYTAANGIEIVAIRAYMYQGVSMTISALYVDSLPGYSDGHEGSLLPQYAADWTIDEAGAATTTVTAKEDCYEIVATQEIQGFYYVRMLAKDVTVENQSLYWDFSGISGSYDVIAYLNGTGNYVYFSDAILGKTGHSNATQVLQGGEDYKGSIKLADLAAKKNITGETFNLQIVFRCMSANLKIDVKEFYVAETKLEGYVDSEHTNSLLPALSTGWTIDEAGAATATVTAKPDCYEVAAKNAVSGFFYVRMPAKDVTVANQSLYWDFTGISGSYDVIAYLNGTGNYVYFSDAILGKTGHSAAADVLQGGEDYKGSIKLADLAAKKNITGETLNLQIVIRCMSGDLKVNMKEFYVAESPLEGYVDSEHTNSLLPALSTGWTIDEAGAATATVTAKSDCYEVAAQDAVSGFFYVRMPAKDVTVANQSLYWDFTGISGSYDVIAYLNGTGNYVYFSDAILGKTGHSAAADVLQGGEDYKGSITLAALAAKKNITGETLNLQIVIRCMSGDLKVNVKEFYVAESPAEALYGNAGTSALAGVTANSFRTVYESDATRNFALNQSAEETSIEVDGGIVMVTEGRTDDSYYTYSLPTDIKIKRNTVLYYDLEGDGEVVDLVIFLSKANNYFNLCEVIKWKETGTASSSNANKLFGEMKGYVTGADIINFLVARGRSGWGFTAADAPNIAEVGIYEIVVYLKDATLMINDLRVVGEYSVPLAVSYSQDNPVAFNSWYISPMKVEKGTSLTFTGSQTRGAEGTENWFSMLFEIRETGKGITFRSDNYCWVFNGPDILPTGLRDEGNSNLIAYFGDGEHETGAGGAAVADWANMAAILNNCDWTLTVTWEGDTVTAVVTFVGKDTAVEGFTATSTYTINAAATQAVALEVGVTAEKTSNLSVTSVTKTFNNNN